jgi:hypothetical protein
VIGLDSKELSIGFNGGMSVLADSIKKSSSIIKPMLKQLSGHNLKLKILSLPKSEPKRDIKKLKKEVFDEPLIKEAIHLFSGSIVKVKALEDSESSEKDS